MAKRTLSGVTNAEILVAWKSVGAKNGSAQDIADEVGMPLPALRSRMAVLRKKFDAAGKLDLLPELSDGRSNGKRSIDIDALASLMGD